MKRISLCGLLAAALFALVPDPASAQVVIVRKGGSACVNCGGPSPSAATSAAPATWTYVVPATYTAPAVVTAPPPAPVVQAPMPMPLGPPVATFAAAPVYGTVCPTCGSVTGTVPVTLALVAPRETLFDRLRSKRATRGGGCCGR